MLGSEDGEVAQVDSFEYAAYEMDLSSTVSELNVEICTGKTVFLWHSDNTFGRNSHVSSGRSVKEDWRAVIRGNGVSTPHLLYYRRNTRGTLINLVDRRVLRTHSDTSNQQSGIPPPKKNSLSCGRSMLYSKTYRKHHQIKYTQLTTL